MCAITKDVADGDVGRRVYRAKVTQNRYMRKVILYKMVLRQLVMVRRQLHYRQQRRTGNEFWTNGIFGCKKIAEMCAQIADRGSWSPSNQTHDNNLSWCASGRLTNYKRLIIPTSGKTLKS